MNIFSSIKWNASQFRRSQRNVKSSVFGVNAVENDPLRVK